MIKYKNLNNVHIAMAIVLSLALLPGRSIAQQHARTDRAMQFGLYGGGILNAPSASFSTLPSVANCIGSLSSGTLFSGGSGGGFNAAAVLGITPLPGMNGGFDSHLGGSLNIGYASATTRFETDERIGSASDPAGNIRSIISRYTIETKLSELRLEPSAQYYIGADLPLMFSLGARLGYLLNATYNQNEQIASPSGATFDDGTRERNNNTGDLENTSKIQAGLMLGIGYDITLSPTLSLRPQIDGALSLTSPIQGVSWSPNEVRFGVALLFTPLPSQSTPLQPVKEGGGKD